MPNNLKHLTFVLMLLTSTFILKGQEPEWLIKPILTDIEHLRLKENVNDLVMYKHDGFWGIKSSDNTSILLPYYNKVDIWNDGKHLQGITGGDDHFFDRNGATIPAATVMAEFNDGIGHEKEKETEETFLSLQNALEDIQLVKDSKTKNSNYHLINTYGDTIIKDQRRLNFEVILGKMISYRNRQEKVNQIIDSKGNVIFEQTGFRIRVETSPSLNKFKVIEKYGGQILFDQNGKKLHQAMDISLIKDRPFYVVSKNGVSTLYNDEDSNPLKKSFSSINYFENSDWVVCKNDGKSTLFNLNTIESLEKSFTFLSFVNKNQILISNNGKLGVFDLVKKDFIIPIEYLDIKEDHSFFIVSDKIFEKKERDKLAQRKIISNQGKVLFSDNTKDIQVLNNAFLATMDDGSYQLLNTEGIILKSYPPESKIKTDRNGFWLIHYGLNREYFFVPDIIAGKEEYYDGIGEYLEAVDEVPAMHIVMKNDKYGAINQEGRIVVPLFFQSLKTTQSVNLLQAKLADKTGVLKRPE